MKAITNYRVALITALLVLISYISAIAVMITPEAREIMKQAGKLEAYIDLVKDAKLRGVNAPDEIKSKGRLAAGKDDVDTLHVLVLLVEFTDNLHTAGDVAAMAADFDSILFSMDGGNPTGSMTDYYLENSYGKFLIRGEVHGWYLMPRPYSFYVDGQGGTGDIYPRNTRGLAYDAVKVADSLGLNFAPFDTYGNAGGPDGEIDGLLIIHAGPGLEQTGNENDIHSHKWNLGNYKLWPDGIMVDSYTIQPEEFYGPGAISPIGVFCHEFGHVLGLPDLYDIDYEPSTSAGIGMWSIMASGAYKNDAKSPSHFDVWCKMLLGFVDPVEVYTNMTGVEIPQIESEPVAYRLWKDGSYSSEYFLVENRQSVGFDSNLPGTGLLIYHIDDATTFNNVNVSHYHVAVEQADGNFQLEYASGNNGDAGDPWPGNSDKRSFDDLSVPNSRGYGNVITQVSVWDISGSDSLMTVNFDIEWSRPYLEMYMYDFADGNLNGRLEPEETVEFYFYLKNHWLMANDAVITMTSNDPGIQFINSSVQKEALIGNGYVTSNVGEPITFRLPDALTPTYDSFFVTVEADGGTYTVEFPIEQQVGTPQILIVDDDRGASYDSIYVNDLYKRLIPADVWPKLTSGSPPAVILDQYNMVFWFTGDTSSDLLQAADINAMKQYLNSGGNLFLTGQSLAGELHAEDSAFLDEYLHARDAGAVFFYIHEGIDGSPIGGGLKVRYASSSHQVFDRQQQITPVGDALPAFKFKYSTAYSALSYSGKYKLVYFNFGYEAISNDFSKYDDRDTVLANILDFFGHFGTEVADARDNITVPGSFDLEQNYPNPFNPTTTIEYIIRSTNGDPIPNTVLMIYNTLGQKIKKLVDEKQVPGVHRVKWDGTDEQGKHVASGIYFYRLSRGTDGEARKMVLLK